MPSEDMIRIQRVRCINCLHTTNVLPCFLLAHRKYSVNVLKALLLAFITNTKQWKKSPDIGLDLSTAYRWLRLLRSQATQILPDMRKELFKLVPSHQLFDPKTDPLLTQKTIFKRFISIGNQLLKAAVRLAGTKDASHSDLFCFLNYSLAKISGRPLLVL